MYMLQFERHTEKEPTRNTIHKMSPHELMKRYPKLLHCIVFCACADSWMHERALTARDFPAIGSRSPFSGPSVSVRVSFCS